MQLAVALDDAPAPVSATSFDPYGQLVTMLAAARAIDRHPRPHGPARTTTATVTIDTIWTAAPTSGSLGVDWFEVVRTTNFLHVLQPLLAGDEVELDMRCLGGGFEHFQDFRERIRPHAILDGSFRGPTLFVMHFRQARILFYGIRPELAVQATRFQPGAPHQRAEGSLDPPGVTGGRM